MPAEPGSADLEADFLFSEALFLTRGEGGVGHVCSAGLKLRVFQNQSFSSVEKSFLLKIKNRFRLWESGVQNEGPAGPQTQQYVGLRLFTSGSVQNLSGWRFWIQSGSGGLQDLVLLASWSQDQHALGRSETWLRVSTDSEFRTREDPGQPRQSFSKACWEM